MSRPEHFSWFQNSDGSYDQDRIGTEEARRNWELTQQREHEQRIEFERREQAYREEQRRQEEERRRNSGSSW